MTSENDFFAELEAEIAKYTEISQLKKDREAARKRANTMTLSPAVRARAAEEYKNLDGFLQAQKWTSVATIALFTEQTCDGCGSVHRVFLQYMELQQMVRKPSTQRLVRVSKPNSEEHLSRRVLLQPVITHICADCCEDHEFKLSEATCSDFHQNTLTPSPNYQQEDINA